MILKKILKITGWVSRAIYMLLIAMGFWAALQTWQILSTTPSFETTKPRIEGVWSTYREPIELRLNVPVEKSKLSPSLSPSLKGQWVWDNWLFSSELTQSGKFYPQEETVSSKRFVIYIAGVTRPNIDESHEIGTVFDAPQLPKIISTQPSNSSTIEKLDVLQINFDKALEPNQTVIVDISPPLNHSLNIENSRVNIVPQEEISMGKPYSISIFIKEITQEDEETHQAGFISINTKTEVGFRGVLPVGDKVRPKTDIKIRFFDEMDRVSVESHLQIIPEVARKIEWKNNKQVQISLLAELEKDTQYQILVKAGAQKKDGTLSTRDISHSFKTLGKVTVASYSPPDGSNKVNEWSTLELTFDQEVNKASAEQKFFTLPSTSGRFEWEGESKLKFIPTTPFPYSSTIYFGVRAGVESIYGLANTDDLSYSFNTRSNQVILSLPSCSPYSPEYCQPQFPVSFSCNVYALKMALSWKGVSLSASSIISEMGYDSSFENGVWTGNPYQEYVGNADGSWGYGVYWGPTKRVLDNKGISSEIVTNWNIRGLAATIEQGSPVIIWRYNGTSAPGTYYWNSSDGVSVKAIRGQHGGVVTGFRGTSDAPTHFLLNDPWFGTIWMDVNTFDYYWSFLDRVGLIVY